LGSNPLLAERPTICRFTDYLPDSLEEFFARRLLRPAGKLGQWK
jgi:hypothetical protein